jgi:hypothetical protein
MSVTPQPTPRLQADVYQNKKPIEWVIEFAVLITVIATLIATGFAARYTGQQVGVARDNENRQVRAYVSLRDIRFEKRNDDTFDIIPQWENTGNSETVGMHAYLNRSIIHFDYPTGFSNTNVPGQPIVPIVLSPKTASSTNFGTIAKACLSQFNLRDGVKHFYVWGWASYGDTLTADQHVTRFCWDIDQLIFAPDGQINRVSHNLCQEGNCADKDCAVPTEKLVIAFPPFYCKNPPPSAPPPPLAQKGEQSSP